MKLKVGRKKKQRGKRRGVWGSTGRERGGKEGREGGREGGKKEQTLFSLPFLLGKTGQFSGFVGKDKSKTYKQENGGKSMDAIILASLL